MAAPLPFPQMQERDGRRSRASRRLVLVVPSRHEISNEAGYRSRKESGRRSVLPSAPSGDATRRHSDACAIDKAGVLED